MTMVPAPAPVVGVGVDWLSMSCNRPAAMARLQDWSYERFGELLRDGWDARPVFDHGRSGYSIGSVAVLTGRTDVLVQLSGEAASRDWRTVAIEATGCGRIDLQATVRPASGAGSLAVSGYRSAQGSSASRGRRPVATLITTSKGADTLYLGRKISDQFARLYDKGSESGSAEYEGCWRYEVVHRRRYATATLQALLATPEERSLVSRVVHDYFSSRGVPPRFDATGPAACVTPPRAVPDDGRWRSWYRRSVRPSAAKRLNGLTLRERHQLLDPIPATRFELEAWLLTFDDDE